MELVLRLMIEVADAAAAEAEMAVIAPQVEACAAIERRTVQQYWKIPAYQEVTLYLRPRDSLDQTYQCLISLAESAWTPGSDVEPYRWSLWSHKPGTKLLSPCVKWAHLAIHPQNRDMAN